MSEMVLLVHATLQWHNIGETQSKFLMLGDMLSVPGLLRSVSDRTGPWRVLPHTLPADWSWHAPSSLGSVRACLRALSGLAERVAERGAPEQPCCLWRALRWEGWWWKQEGRRRIRGEVRLSGTIRFSAECKDQPLPCFTFSWEMEGLHLSCHWLPKQGTGRKNIQAEKKREMKEEGQADASWGLTVRIQTDSEVFDWTAQEENWSIPGWPAEYDYLPALNFKDSKQKRTLQILVECLKSLAVTSSIGIIINPPDCWCEERSSRDREFKPLGNRCKRWQH